MALIQADFFSKSLMRTVTINVIIPTDKMVFPGMPVPEKKPLPTLYLLHGIFGNYTDWVTGTRLQAWAQDKGLCVVMPSGDNHFYVDNPETEQYYGKFIGEDLVQFTRDTFNLSDKREDTFIGGLSMGGYGAIVNGLNYADTFSHIAMLSAGMILERVLASTDDDPMPTHRRGFYKGVFGDLDKLPGSDKDYKALILKLKAEGKEIPKIYMCCGTEDFLYEKNCDYRDFLREQGVDLTWEEGPGVHNWVFWDEYIRHVLDWLPLGEAVQGVSSGNVRAK